MKNCESMCCFKDSHAMAMELIRLQRRVDELERGSVVVERMKTRLMKGRVSIFAQELLSDRSPDKVARFVEFMHRNGDKCDIWRERHKVHYFTVEEALKKMTEAIFNEVSAINSASDGGSLGDRIERTEQAEELLCLYFDIYRQVCNYFSETIQRFSAE